MTNVVRTINAALKRAGYGFRLIRGRGYYYLAGDEVAGGLPASSIYVYKFDRQDLQLALSEVNALLRIGGLDEISLDTEELL